MSFIFTPSLALSATWQKKSEALGSFSQETTGTSVDQVAGVHDRFRRLGKRPQHFEQL